MIAALRRLYYASVLEDRRTEELFIEWLNGLTNYELVQYLELAKEYVE